MRFKTALARNRTMLLIITAFVVLISAMVGYNAYATERERPTALVVDVTARQRTLVERYIKDTILRIDGVQADPAASAKILSETADALLDGGPVVTPQGSLDQTVVIPAAESHAARLKLEHERRLIQRLLRRGAALRAAGASNPDFARDLRRLRITGAELSSVTGDAAGQLTQEGEDALARLVRVEIVLGLLSILAALGMAWLLRKQAKRQSARFRSLVHNSTDLITVLDERAVASYQSPSSALVLGREPDSVVGTRLTDLLHPSDKRTTIEAFALAHRLPGQSVPVGFRLRHADGRWVVMEGTATNLLADRNVRGFVVNSRDVTERERAAADLAAARDEALGASRTKSQFLASMSHEIRTPMNAIIGLGGLMLGTSLDGEQREYAEGIERAADGLLGIINDILDFSKVEAGKLELEEVDFDLGIVVEDVVAMLGDAAGTKNVELLAHIQTGLPIAVSGDPTRIRQVLLNLASNAVKFTTEGEVVVRVRRLEEREHEIELRFEVIDTGVGIAPEDLDRLFDPFSQADASTTRRFGGTGLGLAIVKQLVELMGGRVGVESVVNRGSTFWIEVPLRKQDRQEHADAGVPELESLRTLIVDDNATNRLILREQLGSWGMRTDEAEHGVRALELMHAAVESGDPYEVVVLDLNMPDMDGLELARAIDRDAAIAGPRKFMLSSSGRVAQADATVAGLAGSLTKPVRQSDLFNCLMNGLRTAGVHAEPEPIPVPAAVAGVRGHLLLVEDNAMNQLVATRLLGKLGYTVDVANNGRIALEEFDRDRHVAVLMDCQMPEMDGYEATGELRRREQGTGGHVPIIAMTAAAMDGDRDACLAAGMDDYLTKPIRSDALTEALERWLTTPNGASVVTEDGATAAVPGVLDGERLDLLRGLDDGDGELLREIAREYRTHATAQIVRMREAMAEGDPETVERAAHSVKGSSANLGATQLVELCGRLEALGRARALGDAGSLVDEIGAEFDRVGQALDTELTPR